MLGQLNTSCLPLHHWVTSQPSSPTDQCTHSPQQLTLMHWPVKGGAGTCSLLARRYKAGNLWQRVKWIHQTEEAVIFSEGVKQVAKGSELLKFTREELLDLSSQIPKSLICRNCLILMPKIMSCCMFIQIDLGAQCIAQYCRLWGKREAGAETKTTIHQMRWGITHKMTNRFLAADFR